MNTRREILIVEDNPADVRLMREALREVDPLLALHVASDGNEALEFLFQKAKFATAPRPNLIFLDFNVPKVDSRVVLRRVKEDIGLRSIPVIVFTSSASSRDVGDAYRLFANSYIRKPSDLDQFIKAVRATVDFWLKAPCLISDR